jgi:hypothetical protein
VETRPAEITVPSPRDASGACGDAPPRARIWVGVLFALLLVPGIIGFDFWPLTGWRMYSVSTGATRVDWGVEAVTADGAVDLGWPQLPLAYRLAAWPLATLPTASASRREGTCQALLVGVRQVRPDARRVVIVRDRRTIDDDGEIFVDRERFHACTPE